MENIKVYGIDVDEEKCPDSPNSLNNDAFIEEAERQGLVWSLEGFEKGFNEGDINSDKIIIKILQN